MQTARDLSGLGRRLRRKALAGLGLALACGLSGCGREFYRNWADQDVSEVVFEKSRDPRWRIDLFSIEPPSMARYADPYDPDRPPAPPDDRAAEALAPVPQWPHHRLLVPMEGTGYIDMLEAWKRDRAVTAEDNPPPAAPAPTSPPPPPPEPLRVPVPSTTESGPFRVSPSAPSRPVEPTSTPPLPRGETPLPMPPLEENPGTPGARLTPKALNRLPALPAAITSATPARPGQLAAPKPNSPTRQDAAVHLTALQVPETPLPDPASSIVGPGQGRREPVSDLDPYPREDQNPGGVPGLQPLHMTPDEYAETGRASSGLATLLAPPSEAMTDYEAGGLPPGSIVYRITPEQALKLALINSRGYQQRIEQVYVRALDVTLSRFGLQPQFVAGLTPQTQPRAGNLQPNNQTSFLYRTSEAPGGPASVLSFGTLAGVGKVTSFGGSILAGFANSVVFNLIGQNPVQPTVNSTLPLQIVQPFLRGGGRAVTLEPLTLAERNMLYDVRLFARFRQEFFVSVLASAGGGPGGGAGTATSANAIAVGGGGSAIVGSLGVGGNPTTISGGNDPTIGFLNVLQQIQAVENQRKNVAAFESLLEAYKQMAEGPGSTLSQIQVAQVASSLESQRLTLIQQAVSLRQLFDQYKIQLGLPPDLPLVLDRHLITGFNDVYGRMYEWYREEDRQPEELEVFLEDLPYLQKIVLDGRTIIGMQWNPTERQRQIIGIGEDYSTQEAALLVAERIALENRLELMNGRAQLYDAWRQLQVRQNGLKGIFNVAATNQVLSPTGNTNPFGFNSSSKQFNLVLNAELPLIRVAERNSFRAGLINYRQQQRFLQSLEDSIKLSVRSNIRNLVQFAQQYETQRRLLLVSLKQRDNTARTLFAPPAVGAAAGAGDQTAQTQQLTQSLQQIAQSQSQLVSLWVQYQTSRLTLYRDLGIMPYDEWEAYYELFPVSSGGGRGAAAHGGLTTARAPDAPPERS